MKKQEGYRGFGRGLWVNGLGWGGASSTEKGAHGFGLDQFTWLVQVIHDHRVRVDAQRVVNGGHDLGRVDRGLDGRGSGGIGFAVKGSTADAGTCDERGVAIRPVITAVRGIRVTTGADAEAWASPELAQGHHQGFLQQAPLVEVFQ